MKLDINKWIAWLQEKLEIKSYLAFDIETTGLNMQRDEMHFFTYDYNGEKGLVITRPDLVGKKGIQIPKHIRKALEDKNVKKIIHSSQFDIPFFRTKTGIHLRNIWDTALMETIILAGVYTENEYTDISLKNVLLRRKLAVLDKDIRDTFLDYFGPITKQQESYGIKDISKLRKLADLQLKDIKKLNLENLAKLENMTAEVTAELRFNGIAFDEQMWIEIAEKNEKEYEKKIKALPKEVDNWNSPKQIKDYFLNYQDIEIESLSDLPDIKNKVLDKFKEARAMYSDISTFGFSFLTRKYRKPKGKTEPVVDPDGRIRPSYNQIIETGRYSCSSPNLQNQPAKPGTKQRFCYYAEKGSTFCIGDFTGQELGLIASESKEPVWIEAMKKKHDVHAVMAEKIYTDWKQIGEKGCTYPFKCKCPKHKQKRTPAKDLNFGLAYGKGTESFAYESGMPLGEAYKIVRKYKKSIPRVIKYLESNGNYAVAHGYIRTPPPFNRLRYIIGEAWKKRNRGKNTPIQGGGADMMKLAMCMIYVYIYDNNLEKLVKMVLTVHDELLTECKKTFAKAWCKVMKYFMEESAIFITKDRLVHTDPEITDRWKPKD